MTRFSDKLFLTTARRSTRCVFSGNRWLISAFTLLALSCGRTEPHGDVSGKSDDEQTPSESDPSEEGSESENPDTVTPSDPTPEDCNTLPQYDDDIVLQHDDALALPGRFFHLAETDDGVWLCGRDKVAFVRDVDRIPTQPIYLNHPSSWTRCTGVATIDEEHAVVAFSDRLALVQHDFATISVLDELAADPGIELRMPHALDASRGTSYKREAETSILVAAGTAGVRIATQVEDKLEWSELAYLSSDAQMALIDDDDLWIADGQLGLLRRPLDDPDHPGDTLELPTSAIRLFSVGPYVVVLQGGGGVSFIRKDASPLAVEYFEYGRGYTVDARADVFPGSADPIVTVVGSYALHRWRPAERDTLELVSSELRPDLGDLEGQYFRAITRSPGRHWVLEDERLTPIQLGPGKPEPHLEFARTTVLMPTPSQDDEETLLWASNHGTADLIIRDVTSDAPFYAYLKPEHTQQRPGCPGQFVITPGSSTLLYLNYLPENDGTAIEQSPVWFDSNDPDFAVHPGFTPLLLEGRRPSPEIGSLAMPFDLLALDGTRNALRDYKERWVLLKLFDNT